ncbi:MAG: hypothetical protein ACOCUS_00745 [Polyangiales bacterium]
MATSTVQGGKDVGSNNAPLDEGGDEQGGEVGGGADEDLNGLSAGPSANGDGDGDAGGAPTELDTIVVTGRVRSFGTGPDFLTNGAADIGARIVGAPFIATPSAFSMRSDL